MSKSIKQFKINVNELRLGMFISKLDRPWTQTSFPLQGFYINNPEELRRVQSVCKHVYIDVAKGKLPLYEQNGKPLSNSGSTASKNKAPHKRIKHFEMRSLNKEIYLPFQPLNKSLKKAEKLQKQIDESLSKVLLTLNNKGDIKYSDILAAAKSIIRGVLTNPDAFVWLNRAHRNDAHTYHHAVRAGILSALYGRHLKLVRKDLLTLVSAALVKDLGKTYLNQTILEKNKRTHEEQQQYQSFVDKTVEILSKVEGLPTPVINTVKSHRENLDGSGFPRALRGEKIPLLSQLTHIITFYDETTNPRGHSPLAPSKAIAALYKNIGSMFYDKLVVEFIQAIGLYPTGTLVELKSGEIGLVLEQTPKKRLRPKLLMLSNSNKEPLHTPFEFNLGEETSEQENKDWELQGLDAKNSEILRDVKPNEFDINYERIQDEFVFQPRKNKLFSLLGI